MMRTIEQTIYKFDELSKEVQNRLIEKYKEKEYDFYIDYELDNDMIELAKELLNDYFGANANYVSCMYDLSYSQGDGAMIEFNVYLSELLNFNEITEFTKEEIKILHDCGDLIKVRHKGSYYHEYCFDFDYSDYTYFSDDWTDEMQEKLDKFMEETFRVNIINMNKTFTRQGYKLIEYEPCMNWILERLNENEYYKDGDAYCEI